MPSWRASFGFGNPSDTNPRFPYSSHAGEARSALAYSPLCPAQWSLLAEAMATARGAMSATIMCWSKSISNSFPAKFL